MSAAPAIDPRQVEATLLELLSYESPQAEMERVRGFIRDVARPNLPAELFDEVRIDDAGNLLARRRGPSGTRPLLVFGYGATYPAATMPDAYPASLVPSGEVVRVRGRGACEQRAALTAALVAANTFLAARPELRRGLDIVVSVAGEMGNHLVADQLTQSFALDPAAGVVASSSHNELGLGNLGRVDVHVTIHGQPCHSSDPGNGINALDGARRFLNRLDDLRLDRVDPELGRATVAATFLETAPRASHTIPGQTLLTLDRRLLPGEAIEDALAAIEACAGHLGDCTAEVVGGHFNYPNKVAPDAEVAVAMGRAMERVGLPLRTVYKRSALDAGYFTRRGADCIVFGPGDPRLGHSDDEWVALSDAILATSAYLEFFRLMCSASAE